jgi:transcriptional regulator with XRE-family HTH domain
MQTSATAIFVDRRAEQRRALGVSLRRLLKERDMSQSDLARRLGTSRDNVSGWVRGETFPRSEKILDKMADVLGVAMPDLLGDTSPGDAGRPGKDYSLSSVGNGRCYVYLSKEMPVEIGIKIMELVGSVGTKG